MLLLGALRSVHRTECRCSRYVAAVTCIAAHGLAEAPPCLVPRPSNEAGCRFRYDFTKYDWIAMAAYIRAPRGEPLPLGTQLGACTATSTPVQVDVVEGRGCQRRKSSGLYNIHHIDISTSTLRQWSWSRSMQCCGRSAGRSLMWGHHCMRLIQPCLAARVASSTVAHRFDGEYARTHARPQPLQEQRPRVLTKLPGHPHKGAYPFKHTEVQLRADELPLIPCARRSHAAP